MAKIALESNIAQKKAAFQKLNSKFFRHATLFLTTYAISYRLLFQILCRLTNKNSSQNSTVQEHQEMAEITFRS